MKFPILSRLSAATDLDFFEQETIFYCLRDLQHLDTIE